MERKLSSSGFPAALLMLLALFLAACGPVTPPQAGPTGMVAATIRPAATPNPPSGVVIVDNDDPGFSILAGDWGTCADGDCGGICYAADFHFAEPGCRDCRARFALPVPAAGEYEVWAWWPCGEDRATDTPYTIEYGDGPDELTVDQRSGGDDWVWLAQVHLEAGESAYVLVGGSDSGYANADAVALTPAGSGPPTGPSSAVPSIQYFSAEESGTAGCFYLHWDVGAATAVYLSGEAVDNPASIEVCPQETTDYVLWAENAAGRVEQLLTLSPGHAGAATAIPTALAGPAIPPLSPAAGTIVVDHTCADITRIPDYWLEQARQLTVHYAHTSHGSQIVTGLEWLEAQNHRYSVAVHYCGGDLGLESEPGALRLCDGNPPDDYVTPELYWASEEGLARTRRAAGTGLFHFSMWSWCGQQSENDTTTVQQYLEALDILERDYPGMRFIYMTGHTDGGSDILARNNDMVRRYVREHGKVLFDFASFESYDPAGNYYPDASDACEWCESWCGAHPQDCVHLEQMGDCAHTHPLQCKLKAQAFWWLLARLAGWDGG